MQGREWILGLSNCEGCGKEFAFHGALAADKLSGSDFCRKMSAVVEELQQKILVDTVLEDKNEADGDGSNDDVKGEKKQPVFQSMGVGSNRSQEKVMCRY